MKTTAWYLHYGYVIAVMGVLVVFASLGLGRFSFTMIYPGMMEALQVGNTEMGLLASVNFLGYMIFSLVGGILASKFGPRIVISLFLAVTGITMVLTGMVGSLTSAMVMRFATGIGSGGSNVPIMGLISSWFAPRRRGMAAGMAVGGSGFAIAGAGVLIPLINNFYLEEGWRWSWHYLGMTVIIIALAAAFFLRNSPHTIGLRPVGATGDEPPPETGVSSPFNWGQIYTDKEVWRLASLYFLFGFSYIIMVNFFSVYLILEMELPEQAAGYLWSVVGLLGIGSGFLWGNISDYIGRRLSLMIVFGLKATCYAVFALGQGPVYYWTGTILLGLTSFAIPAIITAAVGDIVGGRLAPAALGMITLLFGIGQITGPAMAGYLVDLTETYRAGFIIAAVAAMIGALWSLTIKTPTTSRH